VARGRFVCQQVVKEGYENQHHGQSALIESPITELV